MARILVVEDNHDIADLIRNILLHEGHTVMSVTDGSQAIYVFDQGSYDLVITDLIMPDQDGFDVIDYVRRQCSEVSILVISGGGVSADSFDALSAVEGIASATLRKPIQKETLLATVRKLLASG